MKKGFVVYFSIQLVFPVTVELYQAMACGYELTFWNNSCTIPM